MIVKPNLKIDVEIIIFLNFLSFGKHLFYSYISDFFKQRRFTLKKDSLHHHLFFNNNKKYDKAIKKNRQHSTIQLTDFKIVWQHWYEFFLKWSLLFFKSIIIFLFFSKKVKNYLGTWVDLIFSRFRNFWVKSRNYQYL